VDEAGRQARLFPILDGREEIAWWLDVRLATLVRRLLPQRQGLLLHAAGVVNGKGAYVFPGPSGSGKTTIARAAREQGWAVLADDGLIVRQAPDGRFRAFRTPWNAMKLPWHGSFGPAPDSAEVRSVFFPHPHDEDLWELLGSLAGSLRIVQAAFPLLKQLEHQDPASAFGLLLDLGSRVPCYDLYFSRMCRFLGRIS
jgi:hypothetical protein